MLRMHGQDSRHSQESVKRKKCHPGKSNPHGLAATRA
jgi:hypothetical protein